MSYQRTRIKEFHQQGQQWISHAFVNDKMREVLFAPLSLGQEAFVCMPHFEGLYSGPRGIGKTKAHGATYLQHVASPGTVRFGKDWRGLWMRPSLSGFAEERSQLDEMIIPIWGKTAQFNQNRHEYTWDSGELLKFGFYDQPGDFATWLGSRWSWLGWSELTEWPSEDPYKQMLSTCRQGTIATPLMVRSTTNPGSSGGSWVRRRFNPPPEPKEGLIIGPTILGDPKERVAVCDTLWSNQVMFLKDENYDKTILSSAINAGQKESWFTGSWNVESGGLFEDAWYKAEDHFLLPSIPIEIVPNSWTFTRGMDWGWGVGASPTAILWAAVSDGTPLKWPDGRVLHAVKGSFIILAELYTSEEPGSDKGTGAVVAEVKEMAARLEIARGFRYQDPLTGKWVCAVRRGVADPTIFNAGPDNAESVADQFATPVVVDGVAHRGFAFEKADASDGSRVRGWYDVRSRMLYTIPPRSRPALYFTADCPELIRTLKHMPRDKKAGRSDDCPRGYADHLGDCLRYLCGRRSPGEATVRFSSLHDRHLRRA